MQGHEHFREAERLLTQAAEWPMEIAKQAVAAIEAGESWSGPTGDEVRAVAADLVAVAQVHAILAQAADWHATITTDGETGAPDLDDNAQRVFVADWLEAYAVDTSEDVDAPLARIRRLSNRGAKPDTPQVNVCGETNEHGDKCGLTAGHGDHAAFNASGHICATWSAETAGEQR